MTTQSSAPKNAKGFEEALWDAANKLRGSVESSEYKHVVLSLIFLKFVSDKFEARRAELVDEGKQAYLDNEARLAELVDEAKQAELDMVEFYTMKNVFYLPEEARWSHLLQYAKQGGHPHRLRPHPRGEEQPHPQGRPARQLLLTPQPRCQQARRPPRRHQQHRHRGRSGRGQRLRIFPWQIRLRRGQARGRVLHSKVYDLIVAEMIEPYKGKIYDPCCGSGGMFVQSLKFIRSHHGNTKDISVYGQELTATTYKLAKMNLAVRGLSANLVEVPADTFLK